MTGTGRRRSNEANANDLSNSTGNTQETPKEIVVGAYMPSDSEVKEAYQRGEFVNKAMSEQRWQRWLHKVKADAWREGHRAAWEASGDGWNGEVNGISSDYDELVRGGMFEDNPYESE